MKAAKILLVDDDPDFIMAIRAILENNNYEVISAKSKAEGLEKLKQDKPELAILDVMMDEPHDGFELAREIRKEESYNNMPILMLTSIDGLTGINFRAATKSKEWLPADAYMDKPVEPETILAEIEKLLSKKS